MTGRTRGVPTRSDALPPVPLTDGHLEAVADNDSIRSVWVPDGRPKSVTTRAGEHSGDILSFWLETADKYVKYEYTSPEGDGLAWYQFKPTAKDASDVALIEHSIKDEYRPLSGGADE